MRDGHTRGPACNPAATPDADGQGGSRIVSSVIAGLVAGILTVIMVTAFGAMIFSGPLSGYVSGGIGLILFGAFALGLVVSVMASFPGTVARPHEIPAAIFALMATQMADLSWHGPTGEEVYVTVVVTIVIVSLCTGIFFFLLGLFRMGDLIRFIPYPVIGGFLAGTGLLLVKGAISAMTDKALTVANLPRLLEPAVLITWLPGLALALFMILILRKKNSVLVMPSILLAAAALFYAFLWFTGTSLDSARSQGWLLKAFEGGGTWRPLLPSSLAMVEWPLVVGQAGKGATILIISAMSLLLNASGLELLVRREVDLNRELKSVGLANMVAGLFGGPVGFHSLSLSALGLRMGASSRAVGIVAACACGATLLFGTSVLSYFPRPIIGSLLLFLGFTFLYEWVHDAWFKLSRLDYSLVLLILAVIGTFGFLQGVGVGLFVAVVLFVVKYSRIGVVRHALSGLDLHSNVDRPSLHKRILGEKGIMIHVLKLQGYIFFGTAYRLLEQVRARVIDPVLPRPRFIVLDFHFVANLDSSAVNSFLKMKDMARTQGFFLVMTRITPQLRVKFERGGFAVTDDDRLKMFPDLDRGMEWCENRILEDEGCLLSERGRKLDDRLVEVFPDDGERRTFLGYLSREELGAGQLLLRRGDPPRALFFVESGRITVWIDGDDGSTVRLRTMGAGTIVGELGVYLGLPATASVVVEEDAVLYRLSAESLKAMEETRPLMASAFHKYVILLVGERLAYTNRTLQALLD